jgi:hypothetical protein
VVRQQKQGRCDLSVKEELSQETAVGGWSSTPPEMLDVYRSRNNRQIFEKLNQEYLTKGRKI